LIHPIDAPHGVKLPEFFQNKFNDRTTLIVPDEFTLGLEVEVQWVYVKDGLKN
jgi:hypothetical protein